ncbi:hypothetical protein M427DRAFT_41480 [Gonapodya prolifera JEL478]|uniref:Casein kinase substrate phosphoprotein PP28 domain-containing protein n=1 Tax=Gonapodya prolifera (strain JEL478) TaxID=1344416 RepID=A0A139ATZ4_GONPJ|nr:hypothetical protein M427DRAFT_41480 [Gonapodya prolifera JEL478]|eukprot:KXS20177.1 hypothetical protein M427DRAFT_41480 [Gonapodya prolifera JEL478]
MSARGGSSRGRGSARKVRRGGRRDFSDNPLDFDRPAGEDPSSDDDDREEDDGFTDPAVPAAPQPGLAQPAPGPAEVFNPNRNQKATMKLSELGNADSAAASGDGMFRSNGQLSRREREALDKERAREAYMKKHLAGQTEEAKRDLARLAQVRKEREEAAKKREEEKKAKEAGRAATKSESLSASKATVAKRLG